MSTIRLPCEPFDSVSPPFYTPIPRKLHSFLPCKGRHTPLGFKIQKEEIQMRNLKRTLSLVLAAVMLVGMMVVGASAASSDFVDGNGSLTPRPRKS